jgi:hypothetical protein
MALQGFPCGEVRRVRSTVAERHAKTLRAAEGDVRAEFPWRAKHREAQQVRRHRE